MLHRPRSRQRNRFITSKKTADRGIAGHMAQGTAFAHTVIDDNFRVAYAEIHGDEQAATAIGILHQVVSWFAAHDVTVEQTFSDNK